MASVRKSVQSKPCYTNRGVGEIGSELPDVHSDSDETFFVPRSSRKQLDITVAPVTQPVSMVLISTTSRYHADEFCDINLDNGSDFKLTEDVTEVSASTALKDKSRVSENWKHFAKKIKTSKNSHRKHGKSNLLEARTKSLYGESEEQNGLPPFEIRGNQEAQKDQHTYKISSRDKNNQKRQDNLPFENILHEAPLDTTAISNKNELQTQENIASNLGSSPLSCHIQSFASGLGYDSNDNIQNSCAAVCRRSSMVDDLLLSIYRHNRRSDSIEESDTLTEHSTTSETPHIASQLQTRTVRRCPSGGVVHRRSRLVNKDVNELRLLVASLQASLSSQCAMLIRELKRRDKLHYRRDQQNDVITAILHALSQKRSQDTRMRFSVAPLPGDSGFMQWHDAMMMCARLPGGIPQEFRRRLWLTLSEKHLQARGVDWSHAERFCFNEWSNPDDDELGDQIVKVRV
ncbi:uncharacterized protein LOC125037573 [Penaeus chinensis]|uniref:uncharacterized protein LOC125037573 n=1 Tax=Penaeus chinensis TaxID=139456 RepID=UPI001FB7551C|nr:uncharacterized protein LOC125037573 [Penaeus chinensis]